MKTPAISPGDNIQPEKKGVAVDAFGGAVIDPTKNVLDFVSAAVGRIDDLREADRKFNDAQHSHLMEIGILRSVHAKEIREGEADRLDKIRQVDVGNAAAAAALAATAIQALAATTDRNAENLRNQLTATAATIAKQTSDAAQATSTQTATIVSAINDRLSTLEKSSYQGAGKQSVSDPMMAELVNQVKALAIQREHVAGSGDGKAAMWGYIVAGVSVIGALVTAAIALLKLGGKM